MQPKGAIVLRTLSGGQTTPHKKMVACDMFIMSGILPISREFTLKSKRNLSSVHQFRNKHRSSDHRLDVVILIVGHFEVFNIHG